MQRARDRGIVQLGLRACTGRAIIEFKGRLEVEFDSAVRNCGNFLNAELGNAYLW